ncbi:uncharacterized protein GIQ15_05092 [Arthroderma uncinatum]|uniref:uncharacterized protein n=1 Tax=Arthroderma uncinatum TaxID=74035 RepID=UPI00144AD05F|nr:uncharacterized protein GIQ15_05092 [Arthroderma uncinatum]KAF3482333.1 hypothetical protein GIQ15_05092 [Arthroderma uncinatum]
MAMETADLTPLLEQLEDNIDEIEEALEPLLEHGLAATAQKLPLMEKAKLHILLTYSIESLIFSYLRLNDVDAKEHPVFKELIRVRQYHEKIKTLEAPPEKRTMTLDKQAAGRFIKHGLAGNDKIDLERAEQEAKEKAMAQLRAAQLARVKAKSAVPQKRPIEESDSSERDSTELSTPEPKKSKTAEAEDDDYNEDDEDEDGQNEDTKSEELVIKLDQPTNAKKQNEKERKAKRARKKEKNRIKRQRKREAAQQAEQPANANANG